MKKNRCWQPAHSSRTREADNSPKAACSATCDQRWNVQDIQRHSKCLMARTQLGSAEQLRYLGKEQQWKWSENWVDGHQAHTSCTYVYRGKTCWDSRAWCAQNRKWRCDEDDEDSNVNGCPFFLDIIIYESKKPNLKKGHLIGYITADSSKNGRRNRFWKMNVQPEEEWLVE